MREQIYNCTTVPSVHYIISVCFKQSRSQHCITERRQTKQLYYPVTQRDTCGRYNECYLRLLILAKLQLVEMKDKKMFP